jgi:hypothetical protein
MFTYNQRRTSLAPVLPNEWNYTRANLDQDPTCHDDLIESHQGYLPATALGKLACGIIRFSIERTTNETRTRWSALNPMQEEVEFYVVSHVGPKGNEILYDAMMGDQNQLLYATDAAESMTLFNVSRQLSRSVDSLASSLAHASSPPPQV